MLRAGEEEMTEPFDPYRKWLGIPPEDRPPHHYRLLGIEPFESDPDVIANAADGRMAQIKSFQIGKYSHLSQQILNEISAARLCLLNPEKKRQYDRILRPRLEEQKRGTPKTAPPALHGPETGPAADAGIPSIETSAVFSYVSTHGRGQRPWLIPVALVLGVSAVAMVALAVFVLGRGSDPAVARQPASPQRRPEDRPSDSSPVPPPADPDRRDHLPADPETEPHEQTAVPPEENTGSADETSVADVALPAGDPGRLLADLLDPVEPADFAGPGPEAPASDRPPEDTATVGGRLPLPPAAARQKAEQRIGEIFSKEFAAATTPDAKLALAEKLATEAEETADDPAARFVLMQFACQKSAEAGELTMSLNVADRMRQLYDFDALALKLDLLETVAAAVQAGAATSATNQHIIDAAVVLADEAVAADNLERAGGFMKLAVSAARKTKDAVLLRRLAARDREIDRMKVRFVAVRKALDVLAENPDDGEANLTAGRWFCLDAGNWEKGLPLLAKGSDAELSGLAKQDMDHPEDAVQQKRLADRWWELATREKGPQQPGIQARAGHWYERALPGLSRLDKAEVEKRLAAIAASAESSGPRIRGVVQKGNVALASNGTTVSGVLKGASNLLDGNSTRYDGGKGLATGTFPCEWTITFPKVYSLREIRFLLYDLDDRHHRYVITSSVDGKEYVPLVDRSQGQWSGWQRVTFSPRPVKSIKLIGLYNSAHSGFNVVEFEAYCTAPNQPPPSRIGPGLR